jgi:hypothetical protein
LGVTKNHGADGDQAVHEEMEPWAKAISILFKENIHLMFFRVHTTTGHPGADHYRSADF